MKERIREVLIRKKKKQRIREVNLDHQHILPGFDILHIWRFSQVDTTTGEAEEDGVEDEYQLEELEVVAADYMLRVGVSNFRNAWESMGADCERVDEYGLGPRESLAEAVNAVINLLGMQPCEVCKLLRFCTCIIICL